MNHRPFQPEDLREFGAFLSKATMVCPMREVYAGRRDRMVIGLRHDVDANQGSLEAAVNLAAWEKARGFRSTYFLLHSAPYFEDAELMRKAIWIFQECGHEIGLHNDAVAQSLLTGEDPFDILGHALIALVAYGAAGVTGTVAHGNQPICTDADFVNDEIWKQCKRRPDFDRTIEYRGRKVQLGEIDLAELDLEYEAAWLPRGMYLSDSGGYWKNPGWEITADFPFAGQLHILQHPDWWTQAFGTREAA